MGFIAPKNMLGNPLMGGFPPPTNNLLLSEPPTATLLSSLLSQPPATHRWFFVRRRFSQLLENLKITEDQADDGETKHKGVVASLNQAYWGYRDETANRLLIGSWGKTTRVRPPRDVDVLFILPNALYWRYEQRTGNRQSQLLQDIRNALRASNPATDIRGDRQVVVVPFNTYRIEVAPAFVCRDGGYVICDAANEGSYKRVEPMAEIAALDAADQQFNGNVRNLTRLLKQWQRYCNVPIKSFHLEAAVKGLLPTVTYGASDEFWFDWLVRDALAHLIKCANGSFAMPVTGEIIRIGDQWLSRAQSAYDRAVKACSYEYNNEEYLAGAEWQKIFGTMIPTIVG
jgi:hypothetical protein